MTGLKSVNAVMVCVGLLLVVGALLVPDSAGARMIYYLVEDTVYEAGAQSIERFMADVSADTGAAGRLFVVDQNQGIAEIRSILQSGYESEGLWGAYMIGKTPYAYSRNDGSSYQNLTDHPLRSLSCPYEGPDEDGIWTTQSNYNLLPVCLPDIWLSRIYPSRSGSDGVQQVMDYLVKNHLLRNDLNHFGQSMWHMDSIGIGQQGRPLDDFQLMWEELLSGHPLYASEDLTIGFDLDAAGQATSFLQALEGHYETVKINVHGTPNRIHFTGVSTYDQLYSSELAAISSNAKLVALDSCSTGKFNEPSFFAGEMLFNGETLLVIANPMVTGYFDTALANDMNHPYWGLGLGLSFADQYAYTYSGSPAHFFGDPTIFFREKQTANTPLLYLNGVPVTEPGEQVLAMGDTLGEDHTSVSLSLSNQGAADLVISGKRIANYQSYDHTSSPSGTSGFIFSITDPVYTGFDYQETIASGASLSMVFTFNPSANLDNPGPAQYTGVFKVMTNDPRVGAIRISVRGNHIFNTGDFEDDGDVDGMDLAVLVSEHLAANCTDTAPCLSDMDGNNAVDADDLMHFGKVFGGLR